MTRALLWLRAHASIVLDVAVLLAMAIAMAWVFNSTRVTSWSGVALALVLVLAMVAASMVLGVRIDRALARRRLESSELAQTRSEAAALGERMRWQLDMKRIAERDPQIQRLVYGFSAQRRTIKPGDPDYAAALAKVTSSPRAPAPEAARDPAVEDEAFYRACVAARQARDYADRLFVDTIRSAAPTPPATSLDTTTDTTDTTKGNQKP